MSEFSVRLVPDGIETRKWNPERSTHETTVHQPTTVPELLQFWHYRLAGVDDAYTMRDLVTLLRRVANIGQLGPMLVTDIEAHLRSADQPSTRDPNDPEPLHYLEVYNVAWVDAADPLHISRDFHAIGRMNAHPEFGIVEPSNHQSYSVSMLPLADLLHLPLRYAPELVILRDPYQPTEELFRGPMTITFGEFVHAVWWDLGFHGSPDDNAAVLAELQRRKAELDAGGETIPWEDVRKELEARFGPAE